MTHDLTDRLWRLRHEGRMHLQAVDETIVGWLEERVEKLVNMDLKEMRQAEEVLGLDEKKEWCCEQLQECYQSWEETRNWKYCGFCGKERL